MAVPVIKVATVSAPVATATECVAWRAGAEARDAGAAVSHADPRSTAAAIEASAAETATTHSAATETTAAAHAEPATAAATHGEAATSASATASANIDHVGARVDLRQRISGVWACRCGARCRCREWQGSQRSEGKQSGAFHPHYSHQLMCLSFPA